MKMDVQTDVSSNQAGAAIILSCLQSVSLYVETTTSEEMRLVILEILPF